MKISAEELKLILEAAKRVARRSGNDKARFVLRPDVEIVDG